MQTSRNADHDELQFWCSLPPAEHLPQVVLQVFDVVRKQPLESDLGGTTDPTHRAPCVLGHLHGDVEQVRVVRLPQGDEVGPPGGLVVLDADPPLLVVPREVLAGGRAGRGRTAGGCSTRSRSGGRPPPSSSTVRGMGAPRSRPRRNRREGPAVCGWRTAAARSRSASLHLYYAAGSSPADTLFWVVAGALLGRREGRAGTRAGSISKSSSSSRTQMVASRNGNPRQADIEMRAGRSMERPKGGGGDILSE